MSMRLTMNMSLKVSNFALNGDDLDPLLLSPFPSLPNRLQRLLAVSVRFHRPEPLGHHMKFTQRSVRYAWFSLAHKHKHKGIRTRRMVNLFQFLIPALLNSMRNKMAHEASAILLVMYMFAWCLGQSDLWRVHGLVLMPVPMSTPPFSQVKATTQA